MRVYQNTCSQPFERFMAGRCQFACSAGLQCRVYCNKVWGSRCFEFSPSDHCLGRLCTRSSKAGHPKTAPMLAALLSLLGGIGLGIGRVSVAQTFGLPNLLKPLWQKEVAGGGIVRASVTRSCRHKPTCPTYFNTMSCCG